MIATNPGATTTTTPATTTPPGATTTTTTPATTTTAPPGSQVASVELEDTPNNLTFETTAQLGGTGRGSLGYWFNVGGYSRFTTNLPAGTYIIRYRYAAIGAATRSLLIDNVEVAQLAFAATGGWGANSTWRTIDVPVTLSAGTRTIELRRTASNSGEINVDNAAIFSS